MVPNVALAVALAPPPVAPLDTVAPVATPPVARPEKKAPPTQVDIERARQQTATLKLASAIAKDDLREIAALIEGAPPEDRKRLLNEGVSPDILKIVAIGGGEISEDIIRAFTAGGAHRLAPIFQAIKRRRPHTAALLAHLGADLARTDSKGRTPLFAAAFADDASAIEMLLDKPALREALHDSQWKTPADIEAAIMALPGDASDEQIDTLASELTGLEVGSFGSVVDLQTYLAHLESLDKNSLGVHANGWNVAQGLGYRVRTLLAIAVRRAALLPDVPDETARQRLAAEIACEVETRRAADRMFCIKTLVHAALRPRLIAHETESVLRRLAALPPGPELSLELGWATHALYVSFSRSVVDNQEVIALRLDNRGAGSKLHENEGDDVYPYVVTIPAKVLEDGETRSQLAEAMRRLMTITTRGSSEGSPEDLYRILDTFKAQMIAAFGPAALSLQPRSFPKMEKQNVGNCVFASHEPGVRLRLGDELATKVLALETQLATERLFQRLTPATLQAVIAQNRERIAKLRKPAGEKK